MIWPLSVCHSPWPPQRVEDHAQCVMHQLCILLSSSSVHRLPVIAYRFCAVPTQARLHGCCPPALLLAG